VKCDQNGELSQDKCGFASKNRDLNNNSWDSTDSTIKKLKLEQTNGQIDEFCQEKQTCWICS